MAILNENLKFQEIEESHRNAFSEKTPPKILLPTGTSLFRFTGHSGMSPWWSETSQLSGLLLSAKASRLGVNEYVRRSQAILRGFYKGKDYQDPGIHNLIIATLNRPVYAFKGTIAALNEAYPYMNREDLKHYKEKFTKPVLMRGGNGQLYIKDLPSSYLDIVVPEGTIYIFDDVDQIIDLLARYNVI